MKISKLYFILSVVLMFILPICYSSGGFDESNQKSDGNYFIITQDAIAVQQDETQLEAQRLSKEADYNLKVEIKHNYLNEMWNTYSATIMLILDLFVMFFMLVFVRLTVFIVLELLPLGINRFVDTLEGWFK